MPVAAKILTVAFCIFINVKEGGKKLKLGVPQALTVLYAFHFAKFNLKYL